jgi:hypothetical protein
MAKQIGKRNKLAGRSIVLFGTALAGLGIWASIASPAKTPSQSPLPNVTASPPTIDNNDIAAVTQPTITTRTAVPAQTAAPATTPPAQTPVSPQTTIIPKTTPSLITPPQQIIPRFRTRGS